MPASIWSVGELVLAAKMNKLPILLYDSTDAGVSFPAATIVTPTLDSSFGILLILWMARSNVAATNTPMLIQPNSDTTATNYNTQFGRANAATASAGESLNTNALYGGEVSGSTVES